MKPVLHSKSSAKLIDTTETWLIDTQNPGDETFEVVRKSASLCAKRQAEPLVHAPTVLFSSVRARNSVSQCAKRQAEPLMHTPRKWYLKVSTTCLQRHAMHHEIAR